jgi:hypothetical protein
MSTHLAAIARRLRYAALVAVVVLIGVPVAAQQSVRIMAADSAVHLRPDPSSPIVLRVGVGTLLDVERREANWYAVVLPPDAQGLRRFGYVMTSAVEEVSEGRTQLPTPEPSSDPVSPVAPVDSTWARPGLFVGVGVPFHRAHINEEGILANAGDLLVVPSLGDDYGFAVSIGHASTKHSIEISFVRSSHFSSATILVPGRPAPSVVRFEGETVYNRVNIDYRRILTRRWRAQPFLLFGFGFPWLKVTEGGFVQGEVVDASYSGLGGDAGAGLSFFAHPKISVHVGAIYRFDFLLSGRGGDRDWAFIEENIYLHGLNVRTGVSFWF